MSFSVRTEEHGSGWLYVRENKCCQVWVAPILTVYVWLLQGYHLVPHHNPHPHHNYGTLVLILTIVHVAAVFYFLWLFTRPPATKQVQQSLPWREALNGSVGNVSYDYMFRTDFIQTLEPAKRFGGATTPSNEPRWLE